MPHTHGGTDAPECVTCQSQKVINIMTEIPTDRITRMQEALQDWWLETARQEVESVAPKAVEYGATDLAEIGRTMGLAMGRTDVNDEEATEIGIYFYELGKIARWTAAIREGRRVSDDTLHDAGIYIKMAQRNRAVGGWPFAVDTKEA